MNLPFEIAWRDENIRELTSLSLVLIAIALVLAGLFLWGILQPKGRVSCASFGSYSDAKKAYDAGATWLDRGGKHGVPCENLLTK